MNLDDGSSLLLRSVDYNSDSGSNNTSEEEGASGDISDT